MKLTLLTLSIISSLAFSSFATAKTDKKAAKAKVETEAKKNLELDTEKSSLKWLGKKVTGQHEGTINIKSGSLEVEKNTIKSGSFDIDMKSLKNLDIKDPEYHKKLTDHLNSEDFFSTEKFPVATFKIKEVKELKGNKDASHEVIGDLSIKGITNPLSILAKVEMKDGKAMATGKATIDRTKYDIRYGSGKFFQNLGDKMIYDTFDVEFNLVTR